MTVEEEDKNTFKVLEFPKQPREDEIPDFVIKMLELMLEKAKAGTLKSFITNFTYQDKEEEPFMGGTVLWNYTNNPLEILGAIELMRSVAIDYTRNSFTSSKPEDK